MNPEQTRSWVWEFDHPPERVWTAMADTARFNEAAGLVRHRIAEQVQDDGSVRYIATARVAGAEIRWRDHPVDWVRDRNFRHLRSFLNGPLETLDARFDLSPLPGGRSRGVYRTTARARTMFGRALLATSFFHDVEKNFPRLAREANEHLSGQRERVFTSAKPIELAPEASARIAVIRARMRELGVDESLVARLADFVAAAPDVDVRHIRPLRLARRWALDERMTIEACLAGVRAGLLEMQWDLLCPNCRGAKSTVTGLDQLPSGAHCATCNIDYGRDFSRNVEMTLRPSPAIRSIVEGEFCLFGPMTTPHVVIQQTLAPGETRELEVDLPPGPYRLRFLHPGVSVEIDHRGGALPSLIARGAGVETGPPATPGRVRFENRREREVTMLVESRAWVADALTGAQVATLQVFRDLFSDEVLRPGDEVGVSRVALMFTDLAGSTSLYERRGDARAYHLVREHFAVLAECIRGCNGGTVKTIGDAVMAAFASPADALRAAREIGESITALNRSLGLGPDEGLVIKIGLHAGACIAVTLNGRLDYFGSTVNLAARLGQAARAGDIVLSAAMAADPDVAALLRDVSTTAENSQIRGFAEPVHLLRIAAPAP
jgi:class 3 adenylate cyclase